MVMTKLTIIGAGSTVFTKNIVVDLLTIKQFKSIEIYLSTATVRTFLLVSSHYAQRHHAL